MIFFQIILVPLFALVLLGTVFMIGVGATLTPRDDVQDDQPLFTDGISNLP